MLQEGPAREVLVGRLDQEGDRRLVVEGQHDRLDSAGESACEPRVGSDELHPGADLVSQLLEDLLGPGVAGKCLVQDLVQVGDLLQLSPLVAGVGLGDQLGQSAEPGLPVEGEQR